MEVMCQVCGKPVFLQDVPDDMSPLFRKSLLNVARMAVHGGPGDKEQTCWSKMFWRWTKHREEESVVQRMATLGGVCPPVFQETKLDHAMMRTPPALAALAWKWGERGLLLHGKTDQCKSRCAYEILRREHMAGRACVQYNAGEWVLACLTLRTDYKAGLRWISAVKDCDLFMIDDFGKARLAYQDQEATQATELLFDVCEYRWKNKLPVIMTTNLSGKEFGAKWGEHGKAFARRLAEFCEVIEFPRKAVVQCVQKS